MSTGELEHKSPTDLFCVPANQDAHWFPVRVGSLIPAALADAASGRPGGIVAPSPLATGLAGERGEHFLALGLWIFAKVVVLEDVFCGDSLCGVEGEEAGEQVDAGVCE